MSRGPTLVVSLLGVPIEIRTPASLLHEVREVLVDLVAPTAPVDAASRRNLTIADGRGASLELRDRGEVVLEGIDPTTAVAALLWRLNAIAAEARGHVVVHAGSVGGADGVVLLPGASGAGKSWLTAELVSRGMGYLSDEHGAIDLRTGLVVPVPKPIDLGPRGMVTASSLADTSRAPLGAVGPLRAVVFPTFGADAPTSVAPVTAAEALLGLCGQCTNLASLGPKAFLVLADVATRPAARCSFGRAEAAAVEIEAWLSDTAAGVAAIAPRALAAVTPWTTTVDLGGELVVFDERSGTTHLLNGAAGLVWLCAGGAAGERAIVDLVLAEAPRGALRPEDVTATVHRLRHLGLLDR